MGRVPGMGTKKKCKEIPGSCVYYFGLPRPIQSDRQRLTHDRSLCRQEPEASLHGSSMETLGNFYDATNLDDTTSIPILGSRFGRLLPPAAYGCAASLY